MKCPKKHVKDLAPFFLFDSENEKNGAFPKIWTYKSGVFQKNSTWSIAQQERKMKFFDFGAFQKIMKMLSHEKILFHMLFGAFHDTLRTFKKTDAEDSINDKLNCPKKHTWHTETYSICIRLYLEHYSWFVTLSSDDAFQETRVSSIEICVYYSYL